MQDILNNSTLDIRLHRKSVSLISDLAECQLGSENRGELPIFSNRFFLKSVVDLALSSDLDLQEKVIYTVLVSDVCIKVKQGVKMDANSEVEG